ncbi:3-phenylpropionate/cinnamic acid dioxygenase small subunit [Pseudoclavibacter sp. JAI123]|uniref:nuclear transport factor 2 family protein n=1 Tax=Pseudoclavibacter sp. JAI123 TaxID=2723065 RepID=UPI0015C76E2B|nr:nuclear transport factor 2 family protein [Pseudoclavibacter sp. JAI123]NYF12430.1 3-phenylpropionate/cinnamic acid dioxygenase small subunit [Pseudoclavibacter sp. JAI123]
MTGAPAPVSAEHAAEILDVLARYGQVIDNRDWDRLRLVFTTDFSFGTGPSAVRGDEALAQVINTVRPYHPHYTTNTVLHPIDGETIKAWSKFLLVRTDGTTASGDYIDTFVRTPAGWRIRVRDVSRGARPPSDPGGASTRTFTSAHWRAAAS